MRLATDKHFRRNALTLDDLISELTEIRGVVGPDAKVVFGCDYGDYCHTEQALPVGAVETLDTYEYLEDNSGYSHSGIAIRRNEPDDDEDEAEGCDGIRDVVVLRMTANG